MKRRSYLAQGALAVGLACVLGASLTWLEARQRAGGAVAIDPDDIGGVVTSAKGPEAGVWVIAESTNLDTRFIRIVVTDDQGRYVLPDLPKANYQVFVRGYGLVDSARVAGTPGQALNLTAVVAPDARAAAAVYPANYWLSLATVPSGKLATAEMASAVKQCLMCHQLGNRATRELPAALSNPTSLEKWDHRTQTGPSGAGMGSQFKALGPQRAMFSDWTDRIAAGALPKQAPPRPRGVERNLVVTLWDWGTPVSFTHTHAATDRRNPTVNANGRIYGPDRTNDLILWMDPVRNTTGEIKIPTRDVDLPRPRSAATSLYWGEENIAGGPAAPRSGAMDEQGRVYVAATIRAAENQPAWCKAGTSNKYGNYFPIPTSGKHVAFYDPKTDKVTLIDTCFRTDHNEFGPDPDNPLYFGQNGAVGWVSMKIYDQTKDEQAAQGWCPGVIDTNGDGKITKPWTEPDQPLDLTKDHRIDFGCYEVTASADGSVWCSGIGANRNSLVRLERGPNPPDTCKAEVYMPPASIQPPITGFAGGVKVDSQGVAWQNWRATDHITSFDRRKCKTLNGPTATGQHCAEGWTVYRNTDVPTLEGTVYQSDLNYLIMVDRFDTAGLGKDVVVTYPDNSDGLLALMPQNRQWVTLRVPYPLGFYTRQAHGRIDDPNAGWKGRGLWSTNMSYAIWHIEGSPGTMGGKGQKAKVAKFQVRPDPLAK